MVRILPNINKKLQMMRKSCVGWDSSSNVMNLFNFQLHQDLFNKQHKQKEERRMRGGGRLIQFPTKGHTKSNSILKRGKLKWDYISIYIKIYLTRNTNKKWEEED
jgi:hypothetical protein